MAAQNPYAALNDDGSGTFDFSNPNAPESQPGWKPTAPSQGAANDAGVNPYAKFSNLRPGNNGEDIADAPQSTPGAQVRASVGNVISGVAGAPAGAFYGVGNVGARLNKINETEAQAEFGTTPPDPNAIDKNAAYDAGYGKDSNFTPSAIAKKLPDAINPNTIPMNTGFDRFTRAAATGALGAAATAPFGGVGALTAIPKLAVMGGFGGVAGEAASEAVPEPLKGMANVAGNVVGGLGAAGALEGASAGFRAGATAARPFTAAGREAAAGDQLYSAAENPKAAIGALDQPGETVPESQPTTFQQTGDMGLGTLERNAETKDPAPFLQRRTAQNNARVNALRIIQPEGDVGSVGDQLRSQLGDIDTKTNEQLAQSLQQAQEKASGLGGTGTPEGYGNQLRDILSDAEGQTRAHERGLWTAVDPEGNLAISASPLVSAAKDIEGSVPKSAAPISGEERNIMDVAQGYPSVAPFNEITALRSRLSTAMRQEFITNGKSPSYARMSQLRSALEGTISDAVDNIASSEAQQVASGQMAPEDAMAAKMAQQRQDWYGAKQAAAGQQSGTVPSGNAGAGPTAFSGVYGTAGQAERGLGDASGVQGVSSAPPLTPNFDDAAAQRLAAASQATKERAQTFGQGPVGQVLKTQGTKDNFKLPDSAVPAKAFHPGPTGFDDVQAFRKAAGNQALPVLQDYATSQLRKSALNPDDTINPAKLETFRRQHADALRAFPELDRKFSDAAASTKAMAEVAQNRKTAMDQAQVGSLGKIIGATDHDDIVKTIGNMMGKQTSIQDIRRLVGKIGNKPDAMQGLRRAIVEHMESKFLSQAEAGTSGERAIKADTLQRMISNNEGFLREVFSPAEVNSMKAVADDIRQSNRSNNALRLPARSNTAQDLISTGHGGGEHGGNSLLAHLLVAKEAFEKFGPIAGTATAAGSIGGKLIAKWRNAGLVKVNDIVKEALLDPEKARALLMKASQRADQGSQRVLARRLSRLSVLGSTAASTRAEK